MNDNLVSRIAMRRAVQKAFRIYQVLAQSSQLMEKASIYHPDDGLTPIEKQVLSSTINRLEDNDIAKRFNLTKKLVKQHQQAAYKKIGATSREHAITLLCQKQIQHHAVKRTSGLKIQRSQP